MGGRKNTIYTAQDQTIQKIRIPLSVGSIKIQGNNLLDASIIFNFYCTPEMGTVMFSKSDGWVGALMVGVAFWWG